MTVQVVELKNKMIEEYFTQYPINVFEDDNSIKMKRVNQLVKPVNELYEQQFEILAALYEFKWLYESVFNTTTYHYMVKRYANLDIQLQKFNKLLKANKGNPEIVEYYQKYEHLYNVNVFEMFVQDYETSYPIALERNNQLKAERPDFEWPSCELNWDVLKPLYKEKLKEVKAEEAERAQKNSKTNKK